MSSCLLAWDLADFLAQWYGALLVFLLDFALVTAIVAIGYKYLFKYVFDLWFGVLASLVTLPVFLLLVCLSDYNKKQSDGYKNRIFEKHTAVGRGGKKFSYYTFMLSTDEEGEPNDVYSNFLQQSGLVNLPKVYLLLTLRYSIVGVEPISQTDEKFVTEEDYARFAARTGFVNPLYAYERAHDKPLTYEEMFQSDRLYVKKVGLFTDLKIVLKAVVSKIRGENKDIFGEVNAGEYGNILLARGAISQKDYDSVMNKR